MKSATSGEAASIKFAASSLVIQRTRPSGSRSSTPLAALGRSVPLRVLYSETAADQSVNSRLIVLSPIPRFRRWSMYPEMAAREISKIECPPKKAARARAVDRLRLCSRPGWFRYSARMVSKLTPTPFAFRRAEKPCARYLCSSALARACSVVPEEHLTRRTQQHPHAVLLEALLHVGEKIFLAFCFRARFGVLQKLLELFADAETLG